MTLGEMSSCLAAWGCTELPVTWCSNGSEALNEEGGDGTDSFPGPSHPEVL